MDRWTLLGIVISGVGLVFISPVQSSTNAATPCEIPVMATLTVQRNFSLERFMGDWYRINTLAEHRDNETGEPIIWSDFKLTFWTESSTDAGQASVNLTFEAREPNATECRTGGHLAYLRTTPVPGKLKAYHSGGRHSLLVKDFLVLMTDYEDFALVYACSQKDFQGKCQRTATNMYVLGRGTSIAPDHRRAVDNAIATLCLNMTNYIVTPFDRPCGGGGRHYVSLLLVLMLVMLTLAIK